MAEMGVSPQEEMANPQSMKMFTVETQKLPEDSMYFRALCRLQSSPLELFVPNRPIIWGPLQQYIVGTGKDSVLRVYVLLS